MSRTHFARINSAQAGPLALVPTRPRDRLLLPFGALASGSDVWRAALVHQVRAARASMSRHVHGMEPE
jgi:hypothetical protein